MTNLIKFYRGIKISFGNMKKQQFSFRNMDKTKLLYLFRVLTHPIETFSDIKFEGKGSTLIANTMAFMLFLCSILKFSVYGYLFNNSDGQQINLLNIFAQSAMLLILWAVCNWSICTLFDGEGTFKEIWIATCYSMLPIVMIQIPAIFLSNIFVLSESMILSSVMNFALLWSLVLLFFGMMTVHQFTAAKTVGSAVVTLVIIAFVGFLAVLFFSIFQQMTGFGGTIATELSGR